MNNNFQNTLMFAFIAAVLIGSGIAIFKYNGNIPLSILFVSGGAGAVIGFIYYLIRCIGNHGK